MYTSPFKVTSKIIDLISNISEKLGAMNYIENKNLNVELRKSNRIKTIHSSLAIENNSLSIEQITAIVDGKRILGNPYEIKEVKNALQTYQMILTLNPYKESDLLKAHKVMMQDLVEQSGKYRSGNVGVFNGKRIIHMAPGADMVPTLMSDLLKWLKTSDVHPLIKSCVFHYEFEFIHPFQDGNGRMGRLWQTVILKEWNEALAWLPVEALIKEKQKEYYNALRISDNNSDCTEFIEFMLSLISSTIDEYY